MKESKLIDLYIILCILSTMVLLMKVYENNDKDKNNVKVNKKGKNCSMIYKGTKSQSKNLSKKFKNVKRYEKYDGRYILYYKDKNGKIFKLNKGDTIKFLDF